MNTLNVSNLVFSGLVAGLSVTACGGRSVVTESQDIYVPAGKFLAGADCVPDRFEPGCDRSYRQGRQTLTLGAFNADRNLIAQDAYARCVKAGKCSDDVDRTSARGKDPTKPVQVTYEEAAGYCHWLGAFLLTPDQFERIARGTDGRVTPWGDADSPCRDSQPSEECLTYESPSGARSVAFNPQWVDSGLIRGGGEFTFEVQAPKKYAAFRCARPKE